MQKVSTASSKECCKLFASLLRISLTHMFASHAFKKTLHGLFYSVFQRHGKKNLKPDLDSPGNILYGNPDAFDLPCDLEAQTMIFRLLLLVLYFTSNFTGKKR